MVIYSSIKWNFWIIAKPNTFLTKTQYFMPYTTGWQLCTTTAFIGGTNDNVLPSCVTTITLCFLLPIWDGGEDWWYNNKGTQS